MNDSFGDRMKKYENQSKGYLLNKVPVIIRIDGKGFHNFCKRFEKPYDEFLNNSLNQVMKFLCEEVQGVKFGQRHSDEISLLLSDYDNINSDAYFGYGIQKICSVTASMATGEFCKQLTDDVISRIQNKILLWNERWPSFDARCFNIPKEEIVNYFWWRLLDAARNSVNLHARSYFSHSQLQNKNSNQMQEMLFQKHNINWNNIPQERKSGFICIKEKIEKEIEINNEKSTVQRNVWTVKPSFSTYTDLFQEVQNLNLL